MEKMLLAELTKNCESKKKELFDLYTVFELANLGYNLQERMCDDVYNEVLAENEFFVSEEVGNTGLEIGERVTDEKFMFLLSDEDFEKVLELAAPIMVERNITDEKGFCEVDWCTKMVDARKNLVEFLLTEIVPESMRETLSACRWNVVFADKLINALKSCIHAA